jgi:RNA polymerase sigma-54 factor
MKLTQYQSLEQRLTPQQIMLSTLLQLPQLKLEQRIKAELEVNPVLEIEEDIIDLNQEETDADNSDEDSENDIEDAVDEFSEEEVDWEDILNDEETFELKTPKDPNDETYEAPAVHLATMAEHLLEQIQVQLQSTLEYDVASYLIYNIKDDGYLDGDLSLPYVAQLFGTTEAMVEDILKKIHKLEPLGVGSRNLQECLLVQLAETDHELAGIAIRILEEKYDDFLNKRFEKISNALGLSMDDIRAALDLIATLNPKPGEGFSIPNANYVVPDFLVENIDDEFVISLNDWNMPELKISTTYKNMLTDKKNKPKTDTRKFLRQKIEAAKWFINSIYQRRVTMLKVMEAIVKKQDAFFSKGPEYLLPMVMKEIAEMIEMDISTVSRVANGKYVQTDYGVYELRSFFTEKMETESGESVSNRKIKNLLRDIIAAENKAKPFSDDALSGELKKKGYNVARRTVTKYREQLDLPVARLRREI